MYGVLIMLVAVPLKFHYIFTSLQHVISQVMVMVILTTMRTKCLKLKTHVIVIFMLLTWSNIGDADVLEYCVSIFRVEGTVCKFMLK